VKKLIILALLVLVNCSCSKVPAGYVGVKVYLLGQNKGVDTEELGVGRYWIGLNEELYRFPTFQQNYVWTADKREGSEDDESFTFQTREGMTVGADIGISYHLDPTKITAIFQKYRKGVDEITDIFLRNHVRDALNTITSTMDVASVYGEGKRDLIEKVTVTVKQEVAEIGIIVDSIYLIGSFRLPESVTRSLNAKIEATQKSQQRENEVQETIAQANKDREQAKGAADAILTTAKAQAEANKILSASLTPTLIEYRRIEKWNGRLPTVSGSTGTFLNLPVDVK